MRRWLSIAVASAVLSGVLLTATPASAAFGYYSPISINSGQVPSTQTDFPVLVSVTDARFKTVANSGHVQNSSGFDIRPYSDSGLTTAITGYELERYNATTGEVIMWVKVASLSSSTTPIYLAYGDSGISTNGSSTTTWSNSFVFDYHLPNGTVLTSLDSTSSGYNLTPQNTPTAGTGKIDGCGSFASASNQFLKYLFGAGGFDFTAGFTLSAWVNATSFPNAYNTAITVNNNGYVYIYAKSTGKLALYMTSPNLSYDGTGSTTLSTGTWYLVHFTYNASQGLIGYVNATSDGTVAASGNFSGQPPRIGIGTDEANAGRQWNGLVDEGRLSVVARSANWITTEYNNQSAPGTFETLGTEVPVAAAGGTSNFLMFMPH